MRPLGTTDPRTVAGIAGLLLAGAVLAVPSAPVRPFVLAAWLTWAALALRSRAAT